MARHCIWALGLIVCQTAALAWADEPASDRFANDRAAMVARIDAMLDERCTAEGVTPAPLADDGEFLRRAFLDLTGAVPTVFEVREYQESADPNKRQKLISTLLKRPGYPSHLANTWRNIMLPRDLDLDAFGGVVGFQSWLRMRFTSNEPYDAIAADMLITNGNRNNVGPALFYTAQEFKPEQLAATTARVFLGVQIQCAQCHKHPFDSWTQEDFWGYAAFFARVQGPEMADPNNVQIVEASTGEVTLPESETVIPPMFLGGIAPDDRDGSRRTQLAIWLASRDNPYFAKATVNRVWGLLFGRGLVEPVDDIGPNNPPSHPELFDELANYFVDTDFDLRNLFQTLASTQAYARTSRRGPDDPELPPELVAQMSIKTLSADQLFDSFAVVTRRGGGAALANLPGGMDQDRADFVARFQDPDENTTEFQSGIPQALTLMNGSRVAQVTSAESSALLQALDAPFLSDEQRVETLFLATLGRNPQAEERAPFVAYVSKSPDAVAKRQALSDVMWALLNSAEFALNH